MAKSDHVYYRWRVARERELARSAADPAAAAAHAELADEYERLLAGLKNAPSGAVPPPLSEGPPAN